MLYLLFQVKNVFCDDLRNFEPKIVTPLFFFFFLMCTNAYKSKNVLIGNISTHGHATLVFSNFPLKNIPSGCKIEAKSLPMTILGGFTVLYSRLCLVSEYPM
jgi:hypothetical protein